MLHMGDCDGEIENLRDSVDVFPKDKLSRLDVIERFDKATKGMG